MKTTDFASITGAARLCGLVQATLQNQVAAGRIRRYELADGAVVVRIAEVRRWAAKPRKAGRPRKK